MYVNLKGQILGGKLGHKKNLDLCNRKPFLGSKCAKIDVTLAPDPARAAYRCPTAGFKGNGKGWEGGYEKEFEVRKEKKGSEGWEGIRKSCAPNLLITASTLQG